jgi:hypothetical protein
MFGESDSAEILEPGQLSSFSKKTLIGTGHDAPTSLTNAKQPEKTSIGEDYFFDEDGNKISS